MMDEKYKTIRLIPELFRLVATTWPEDSPKLITTDLIGSGFGVLVRASAYEAWGPRNELSFWIDLGRLRAFLSNLPSCSTTYLVLHRSFLPIISSSWDYKTSIEQISDCPACMSPDWVEPPLLARSVCTKSLGTIRWVSDSMNLSFFWGICRWVADSIICPLKKKTAK